MFSRTLLVALFTSTFVRSAPTAALDATSLLQNGQLAQQLNTEFANLSANDSCTTGQTACISGALAQCTSDSWTVHNCPNSLQCFAVPSVRESGAIVECTSQRTALSLIVASGAQGGLTTNATTANAPFPTSDGDNGTNDDGDSNDCNSSASQSITTDIPSATSTNSDSGDGQATVTVFVTLGPTPTTLTSETTTLSPDQAASLLSSLAAGGSFTVVSTILPSAVSTVTIGGDDVATTDVGSASTILLTSQGAPAASASAVDIVGAGASSSSPSIILLTSRISAPAATATSAGDNSGHSGY